MSRDRNERDNEPRRTILRITIVGVFSALAFVLSAFLAIPYPGGGYFSFGDVATLLTAMLFGPFEGAFVGMLSGAMSDWFAGYLNFLPWTVVAKALLGGVSGLLFSLLKRKIALRYISPFTGAALMIGVYAISYWVFYGNGFGLSVAFDVVQGFGASLLASLAHFALWKTGVTRRLNLD